MRVHVVDPSAYTPPYDHALCSALGAAGADVELVTSRFAYGDVPTADGYTRDERFYRAAARVRGEGATAQRARRALKLAEHVPDMLRYRRAAQRADVVHFQWLAVQQLDGPLLPRGRPLVLTAHDVLPREPRPGQLRAQRRLYERVDAVVVHSEHGAARLRDELGIDPARVHAIPHGAFAHFAERAGAADSAPLPPELAAVP
ncbi:MAG TPA: glycosyltransferase family 4 protein, partial [Solirubrobacteraceae bacterium]